jgi:hypothetical protein
MLDGERFQPGLPGCFAGRLTLRVELFPVGFVVGTDPAGGRRPDTSLASRENE